MMNNLFSIFDPSSNFLSLNWLALFLPFIFINKKFYYKNSRSNMINILLNFMVMKELKTNIKKKFSKNTIYFITLFMMTYTMNIISVLPFIFTPTSQIPVTLFLTLPFWLALMMMMITNSPKHLLIHMLPYSTPTVLCMFMILIETISSLIRPLTLTIRLTANMIAGHILMSLLSNNLNNNIFIFLFTSIILNILILLELSVALIQSYVLVILMSLYLNETK